MNSQPLPAIHQQVFTCTKCKALCLKEDINPKTGRCKACTILKYRNKKVIVDGVTYDSIKEYDEWCVDVHREQAGEIERLRFHPSYEIVVAGVYIGKMTLDSSYTECKTGIQIHKDVKSSATKKETSYRLRKKLIEAIYDITITEV